jgi:hypothetical protein
MKKKYFIKYWETEQDRKQGNSEIYLIVEDKLTAVAYAEKIFYKNDFSCVEVQTDEEVYLTLEQ